MQICVIRCFQAHFHDASCPSEVPTRCYKEKATAVIIIGRDCGYLSQKWKAVLESECDWKRLFWVLIHSNPRQVKPVGSWPNFAMYWKWQGCFNFHFVLCCSSTFLSRKETYLLCIASYLATWVYLNVSFCFWVMHTASLARTEEFRKAVVLCSI